MEVEIDAEGNVSEGREWESGYDEGASRGRDGGGVGGAAGVVWRSPWPRQCPKKGLRTPAKEGRIRGAGAAATGAGATAAAGASVLPLATTGSAIEKSVRAGLGRG